MPIDSVFPLSSAAAPLAGAALNARADELGASLGLWTVAPFALTLLAIALLPLLANHWWERSRSKQLVIGALALPVAAYLLFVHGELGRHVLIEKAHEYVSFLVLLGALFVITGGVWIRGSLSGTPLVNTAILGIGALIASAIGTTGASVLLIRPLLRANAARERKAHIVVFFIFVVSNCGGLLTPLGDPPLYLGYLKGVPFGWTLGLWKVWLVCNGLLLAIFHVWDEIALNREERERAGSQLEAVQRHEPLRIEGKLNLVFLAGVVAVIYASGAGLGNGGRPWGVGVAEAAMLALTALAWFTTPKLNYTSNAFSWAPIEEVAILFAGIFVTMAPALLILNAWGQGQREVLGHSFGLHAPWQYFWATGGLSSFLDNAPTYLTFTATAAGSLGIPAEGHFLAEYLARGAPAEALLAAISCGAVLMGANTYIGNGPNFMVKVIAEQSGVKMPGFFKYMLYSSAILLPIFGLVTWMAFRG